MIVEITTGPGEVIDDLQPIKDAIRALGHRLDFIEVHPVQRAQDYDWKLQLRSPSAAQAWRKHRAWSK